MPVGFPQVLDVSDLPCITVVEQFAKSERRFHTGLGIAIPAGRRAELDAPQRENIEATGSEGKIKAFIDMMRPFGIKELVRTGRIAVDRSLNNNE